MSFASQIMNFLKPIKNGNLKNLFKTSPKEHFRAKIHVKYSNIPEYKEQFNGLLEDLNKTFPNLVSVTGEALRQQENVFEVAINDEVIHSKRLGDGFTDKQCKKKIVLESVRLALQKAELKKN